MKNWTVYKGYVCGYGKPEKNDRLQCEVLRKRETETFE